MTPFFLPESVAEVAALQLTTLNGTTRLNKPLLTSNAKVLDSLTQFMNLSPQVRLSGKGVVTPRPLVAHPVASCISG